MAESVIERILARVKVILELELVIMVERGREDPFDLEDLPAINLRRASSTHEAFGGGTDRVLASWSIEINAAGPDWETTADMLHVQAHAALSNDAALAALGAGLRCTATDCRSESSEQIVGQLAASYQMQVLSHTGDLGRRAR